MSDLTSLATVHVDLPWLALDAEFSRLLAAPEGYLCAPARAGLGDALVDFYDWGRHVPDPAAVLELSPLEGLSAVDVIAGMVAQLQPLVDQAQGTGDDLGEFLRLERVKFFLRCALDAQREGADRGEPESEG